MSECCWRCRSKRNEEHFCKCHGIDVIFSRKPSAEAVVIGELIDEHDALEARVEQAERSVMALREALETAAPFVQGDHCRSVVDGVLADTDAAGRAAEARIRQDEREKVVEVAVKIATRGHSAADVITGIAALWRLDIGEIDDQG
jgi:hypothetical protein